MVLDGLRGSGSGGRCSSTFTVIFLFIGCFIITCNWWSVSTENSELISQVIQLEDKLKISIDERDKYQSENENLKERLRESDNKVAIMHVRLQNQIDLKKQNDELADSISMCKSEVDSLNKLDVTKTATLEALRLEKESITTQVLLKKEEISNLMADINRTNSELEKLMKSCNNNTHNNNNINEKVKDLLPKTDDITNELEENSLINNNNKVSNEENTNKKLKNENTTIKITDVPNIVYNMIKDKNKKVDVDIK
ncbi:myb-like protein D [Microplitis mediator]|uniref:myb-like protein D n=1 Tax=Microplitis mediator TaxID=375433 RepID=UPI00255383BF|nr:myb-like protein D [Microplitis mediator]